MKDDPRTRMGPMGPDIDLNETPAITPSGQILDEAAAAALAERTMQRFYSKVGRPSVSSDGARTPSLTVRVPRRTREALEQIARTQGRRLADVSRDALNEYVAHHQ